MNLETLKNYALSSKTWIIIIALLGFIAIAVYIFQEYMSPSMNPEYIENNALFWSVQYMEHDEIDQLNIREATIQCMHKCINDIINQMNKSEKLQSFNDYYLLVDGNDFKPYGKLFNNNLAYIKYTCIESGDNLYTPIAAASILAKVYRDDYIEELCNNYPDLQNKYHTQSNKGYGSKNHLAGIREHGISQFHRKTFGICKTSNIIILDHNSSNQTSLQTNN